MNALSRESWLSFIAATQARQLIARLLQLLHAQRFVRFIVVGALNTLVGYGLFLLALWAMPTTISALVVANIAAILFNFRTIGSLVFEVSDHRLLLRFFGVYGILFVYNLVGITLLENAGIAPWLGSLALMPCGVLASYILNKKLVFGVSS